MVPCKMIEKLEVDYLVLGSGGMGMAFADELWSAAKGSPIMISARDDRQICVVNGIDQAVRVIDPAGPKS